MVMKEEFERLVGCVLPEDDYATVEKVYTWYDDKMGKQDAGQPAC